MGTIELSLDTYTFGYHLLFIETLTFEQKNNSLCLKNCIWKINIFLNCYDHFLVQTGAMCTEVSKES